jgi:hypothetical protein
MTPVEFIAAALGAGIAIRFAAQCIGAIWEILVGMIKAL